MSDERIQLKKRERETGIRTDWEAARWVERTAQRIILYTHIRARREGECVRVESTRTTFLRPLFLRSYHFIRLPFIAPFLPSLFPAIIVGYCYHCHYARSPYLHVKHGRCRQKISASLNNTRMQIDWISLDSLKALLSTRYESLSAFEHVARVWYGNNPRNSWQPRVYAYKAARVAIVSLPDFKRR